jgi:cytochrome c oxidase assembly factor 3
MSPGLRRARAQYRTKNAITGIILAAFGIGIYAYSISAVKQEDFGDIDAEARAIQQKKAKEEQAAMALTKADEQRAMEAAAETVITSIKHGGGIPRPTRFPSRTSPTATTSSTQPRGIVAKYLDQRYPSVLDPQRKTLVWGAPPVDSIGKDSERL